MREKGKREVREKGFLIVTPAPTILGRCAAPRPLLSRTPKINMSAGSYLRGRTILFLTFERTRAIICILLEALGSTSVRVIARSASPLGPSVHHDRFALAAEKRRERKRR